MAVRLFRRFFGNSISTASGVAIGAAINPTLNPLTQDLANRTWALHPDVPPDAYALAEGVAQGQVDEATARAWAAQTGIGDAQFSALVDIANVGPGEQNAYDWLHRGLIGEAGFRRALKREGWEDEWIDDAWQARVVLLSVSELANAVVQGHMSMDAATAEAGELGYSAERFNVLVENTGLPPGPETGLAWLRRGILDDGEFGTLVREGHTKTKYIAKFLEARQQLLTVIQVVDAHLRGYISEAEMYAGTAKLGYSQADTDIIFKSHGRPITVHQITTGLARGGVYDGPTAGIPDEYLKSLQEGSIKPPWYNLAYANRYTLPSFFVLRALVQDGTLTRDEGADYFKQIGWPPTLAEAAADAYAGGTTAKADPYVKKADAHLWATTHRSYLAEEIDAATAREAMTALAVTADAQTQILALWDRERALTRAQLTPAQVKKAYRGAILNRDTGQTWTRDDAVTALLERGYSANAANEFLDL